MSQITIIPQHNIVCIDSVRADVAHIDMGEPEISIVKFDTETQKGVIEYCSALDSGLAPAPQEIDNLFPWEGEVEEAKEIIFCRQNPKTYYKTVSPVGSPIRVTDRGWPQPPNSTEEVPPAQPSKNTTLYWNGAKFVWSAFPIDLSLVESQEFMKEAVNSEAYSLLQPTDWYVVRKSETGAEIPQVWGDWRGSVRTAANEKRSTINSQQSLEDLQVYCQSEIFLIWPPSP